MIRMFAFAALAWLPCLAPAETESSMGPEDTCGARGFQGLIGQSAEIARLIELDWPMRVIGPTTALTMDYRLKRINFDVDEADRIIGIHCD